MAFWQAITMQLAAFRPGIMSAAEIGEQLIMVCMEIAPEQRDDGHGDREAGDGEPLGEEDCEE